MYEHVTHTLPPVCDERALVLILGTMPSPRSRAEGFYYAHPQNRFWPVLAAVFGCPVPPLEQRAQFAHAHRIALWDVLASCEIQGAADGSIRNPQANPVEQLLARAHICRVFTTGKKSSQLYKRYLFARTGLPDICLPSPSAANCAASFEQLCAAYAQIARETEGANTDGSGHSA